MLTQRRGSRGRGDDGKGEKKASETSERRCWLGQGPGPRRARATSSTWRGGGGVGGPRDGWLYVIGLNRAPHKDVEPQPAGPQNVIVFGKGVFADDFYAKERFRHERAHGQGRPRDTGGDSRLRSRQCLRRQNLRGGPGTGCPRAREAANFGRSGHWLCSSHTSPEEIWSLSFKSNCP